MRYSPFAWSWSGNTWKGKRDINVWSSRIIKKIRKMQVNIWQKYIFEIQYIHHAKFSRNHIKKTCHWIWNSYQFANIIKSRCWGFFKMIGTEKYTKKYWESPPRMGNSYMISNALWCTELCTHERVPPRWKAMRMDW